MIQKLTFLRRAVGAVRYGLCSLAVFLAAAATLISVPATAQSLPTLSIDSPSVIEGNSGDTTTMTFTVTLSASSADPVSVRIGDATTGSALSGTDYDAIGISDLTIAAGATSTTFDVTVTGDALDEEDETVVVNLSNPTNATIATGTGTGTITDNDAPPSISITDTSVAEVDAGATSTLTFTASLSAGSGRTVTVQYADAGSGTATSGTDYTAVTGGTLTFAAGVIEQTVDVTVTGDAVDEADETVVLTLSNATNATIAAGTGTGTITDNDDAPTLSIADTTADEGDSGTSTMTFNVTLSVASGKTVSVTYADNTNGSATSGTDYAAVAGGTLTFAPGDTRKTIDVIVNGDTTRETGGETVQLALSNANNATIATAIGTGTITDDDGPALSIADTKVTEGDSGTVDLDFTVTLSVATASNEGDVTVVYSVTGGTATSGTDYEILPAGTLTFPEATTTLTQTITVKVKGDDVQEGDETIKVTLSSPSSNAIIEPGEGTATGTIEDNEEPAPPPPPAGTPTFDYSVTTTVTYDEADGFNATTGELEKGSANGGDSIAAISARIVDAITPARFDADACYVISGSAAYAIEFQNQSYYTAGRDCRIDGKAPSASARRPGQGVTASDRNGLRVEIKEAVSYLRRGQAHLDYEKGAKQQLIVTAYSKGKAAGTLTVNIDVKNFDESPYSTVSLTNPAPTWYLTKGESKSIRISQYFGDAEGAPVYFDTSADSTDVWVCDSSAAGDSSFHAFLDGSLRTDELGGDVSYSWQGTDEGCSVSNDDAKGTPSPGKPGEPGNRVVTTRKVGPILHVTADSLKEVDANDKVVDRGKGTYTADIWVRAWTGSGKSLLPSRNWLKATAHVKVGANNVPQFAGGATGYLTEIEEGSYVTSACESAWLAGDLDQGGVNDDKLTYSLEGQGWYNLPGIGWRQIVGRAGGAVWVDAACTDANDVGGIRLIQAGVDFETATSYTVNLQVTDKWSAPVSVPVTVTVKDVNELNRVKVDKKDKEIGDQKVVNGLTRTFDLDDYFVDPDAGDEITYSAHTNIYTNVVSVGEGGVLTITGANAEKGKPSEVTVTVVATDGELSETMEFKVTSRYKNDAPKITLVESGTIAIGASVFEADSAGTVLATVAYTDDDASDDDAAPTAMLTGSGSAMFNAIVNPYMKAGAICAKGSSGCAKQAGKVAIVVGKDDLNHEAAERHVLRLALQDSWEEDKMSKSLEIQVNVNDSNDAPTVKEGAEIADQSIVVNGSGSLYTGDHFEDEDGDRLLVDAASSDMTKVMVSVSGLDKVTIAGVEQTEEDAPVVVTLTASDPDGATATLMFNVTVGANNAPVADEDAFMAALPENNTVNVGGFADVALEGLFTDPDGGDMVTSITASTSDEDTLLVVESSDGSKVTLVGRASGMATLTITAMDQGGNSTDQTVDITVNAPPAEAKPIEAFEMDRTTPEVISVAGVFTDGDDGADMLTITAEAVGEGMDRVELAMMDGELTITGVRGVMPGDVEIKLTATDPHGATATSTFTVSVVNVGPTVAMSLEDFEMDRINPVTLDVSGVFADADGDMLTVTAEVKDAAIAELSAINENGELLVTALAVGSTSVVLTAVDEDGASIMADFEVTVINIDPVVAEAVPDQSTTRADDLTLSISGHFDDPDQDNALLTFDVAVANEMFVSATLADDMLTISGLDVGTSAITLTATDADGGMVETTFSATIDNVAPVVANSISPITLEVGGQAASQSLAGLFTDDDDTLSFDVTSSNAGIASTSLTGMTAMVAPMSRGSATITVTATDPHGASATVTGSVTVGDGELKAVAAKSLAGFGRAMLASVSSSVGSRLMNDARSSDLTLDAWAPVDNHDAMSAMTSEDRSEIAWNTVNTTSDSTSAGMPSTMNAGHMSGVDALRSTFGQSFALNLGSTDNRSNWSVWGDIDRQSYEGAGYDGMASSIYLGADVTVAECWMFGVAVSTNSGESDYTYGTATQTMDMSLTTVLPYVSYQPSHGSSIWGVAGFGSGELETTVVGAANETSDLSTQLTLVGGSQDLTRLGRMNLALRGDAAVATVETDDGNGAADGLGADVNRIRIGLEGSFKSDNSRGGMVEPFGQISLRSDGGDGDTGTGVEVAGGIRMTSSTFTLEAQGRTLAMHGADEYSESGFSLMAKLNPSASATGVSVSIAPRWGADALGNGMLWQDTLNLNSAQTYGALAGFGNAGATKSIDTQIGYGMLVASEQYLLTPFVDLGVSDGDRREMLLGVTLQQMVDASTNLDVNLALGRVEERTGASSGKIGLNATLRF